MQLIRRPKSVLLASWVLLSACATPVDDEDGLQALCTNGRCGGQQPGEPDAGGGEAGSNPGGQAGSAGQITAGSAGISSSGAGSGGGGSGGEVAAGTGGGGTGGSGVGGESGGGAGGTGGGGGGGTGGGGAGGMAIGGGGTGGTQAASCPAKSTWTATSSGYCGQVGMCADPNGPFPPTYAIDTLTTTRFSTGKPQAGDEWIEIDFKVPSKLDGITIYTDAANGLDYPRHYEVRLSNTSGNMVAAVLAEGDGMTGTLNVTFAETTGRYLLVSQTGAVMNAETSWWSLHDLNVSCNP